MERALAEKFIRELSVMGDHLNRLHELIQAQVIGDELQEEFRKSLGEVMGGAAVITMHISRFHPDLDPDNH